jgi:signal transduction histidine kinase
MTLLSSLRSRIFLASALLAVICIAISIALVNVRVTQEAERTIDREMLATGAQIDQLRAERSQTFTVMARLIADLPKLKAAMATDDPPTVEDVAGEYRSQLNAPVFVVRNRRGRTLYSTGVTAPSNATFLAQPNGVLQVVTVPVTLDQPRQELLGTLTAGFLFDDHFASQLKQITGSDLAFGMDGRILASTLPRDDDGILAPRLAASGTSRLVLGGAEYEALARPLERASANASPVALILRSRTEQLQSLRAIHTGFAVTALLGVMLALGLSFAVARTIAGPLATIADVMREMSATGDLTRKIALRHGSWDDEDARLLASTFNALTDSIARFQREMSQKERLTALGRLSTVIAHEVRNPLMIIKASLHGLGQPDVTPQALREAVADIDEEVGRLNRIVNEVLDFARPIRFDLGPVDINGLCRESAAAAMASGAGPQIEIQLDPAVHTISADHERLRLALVNMLVNARHATNGNAGTAGSAGPALHAADAGSAPSDTSLVTVTTRVDLDRVVIAIADRGIGITSEDLGRIFDPYFTTKRGGTGLGLPIAKNIVEGLGGTIAVSSIPGHGTEIRVEFPNK